MTLYSCCRTPVACHCARKCLMPERIRAQALNVEPRAMHPELCFTRPLGDVLPAMAEAAE